MSGKEGKQNAVAAKSFGDAADFVATTPGKATLLDNDWASHGAKCDGMDANTPGCFLDDAVRLRFLIDFKGDVITAATNYKLALEELRVEELMKKQDDLNWVLSLVLEIAGGHLVEMAVKALTVLKGSAAQRFAGAALRSGNAGGWNANASRALAGVSKKQLETLAKVPINSVKGRLSKGIQNAENGESNADKNAIVVYIDQLKNQADGAFKAFASMASAAASDAELVVLFEGMTPDNHSVGIYKALLREKLKRFRSSGVLDLGRKAGYDRETGYAAVYRDTRVVWVRDFLGNRRLYFESQEGNADPSIVRPGDPGSEQTSSPQAFGPHDPRELPVLGEPVPDEFKEVAIARSQQQWGVIKEIEDPTTAYLRWRGFPLNSGPATPTVKAGTPPPASPAGAKPTTAAGTTAPGPPAPLPAPMPTPAQAPALPAPTPAQPLKGDPSKISRTGSDPMADPDAAGM